MLGAVRMDSSSKSTFSGNTFSELWGAATKLVRKGVLEGNSVGAVSQRIRRGPRKGRGGREKGRGKEKKRRKRREQKEREEEERERMGRGEGSVHKCTE